MTPQAAEQHNQQFLNPVVLHELGGENPPGEIEVNFADGPLMEGIALNEKHSVDVLAVVMAGEQEFAVIDTGSPVDEETQQQVPKYALARVKTIEISGENPKIDFSRKPNGSLLAVGLPGSGQEIAIGRNITTPGYEGIVMKEDMAMSSGHFTLRLNAETGSLKVMDGGSTTGSYVVARESPKFEDEDLTVDAQVNAEDTLPRERIDALHEPAKSETIVEPAVVEDVGEVAVEAVVEEPESHEQTQEAEKPSLRRQKVLAELQETWGFTEAATDQEIIQGLELEYSRIAGALRLLNGFETTRQAAVNGLHKTQAGNGPTYLGMKTKGELDEFFNGTGYAGLLVLTAEQASILPKGIQSKIHSFNGRLRMLSERYTTMTRVFRGNDFRLDMEAGGAVASILGRQVPGFKKELELAQRSLTDKLTDLGHNPAALMAERLGAKGETYRDTRINHWAAELEGEVGTERLEEIRAEMESLIRVESGMVDDPNSPSRWFGDRVISNQTKQYRQPEIIDGKEVHKTTSTQRLVAELMSDILSGKFDINLSNDKQIVTRGGKTIQGQGRAAAFAMIYGKQWQAKAREFGLEVDAR